MSKTLLNTILFIAGCVVLYVIANQLIASNKIKPYGEFIASSTAMSASSTENSNTNSSTTTPKISSFTKLLNLISSSSKQDNVATTTISQKASEALFRLPSTSVYTTKGSVKVFIANTSSVREQGLSNVSSLPDGEGELFVFDNPGSYGFWMKDMLFPLDLIWIDSNKTVVGVTKNALPSSYPFVFMPPRAILYVIEMNAGSVAEYGLTTGTSLKFSLQ